MDHTLHLSDAEALALLMIAARMGTTPRVALTWGLGTALATLRQPEHQPPRVQH